MGVPVDSTLDFDELAATPGAPAAGITRLYSKTAGGLYVQSSAAEQELLTAGSTAGGDLSGSYPNPSVAQLQGRSVSSAAPAVGQAPVWSGSAWAPSDVIAPGFTYAAMQGNGVQAVGTAWAVVANGTGGNLGDGTSLAVPAGQTWYAKVDLQILFQANSANWTPLDGAVYAWSPATGNISGHTGAAGSTNGTRVRGYSYGTGAVGQPSWNTLTVTDVIELGGGNNYAFYGIVVGGQDGSAYGSNVDLTFPWGFITAHRIG